MDVELIVMLNTYCNYKCVFCNNPGMPVKERLPLDRLKSLCEVASKMDISGYGEVMTHPEFPQIIQYLTDKKVAIRLTTNGFLLNADNRKLIAESTIKRMVISVNSLNRETYKKLMGVDGLPTVLANIEELVKVFKGELIFSFVMNAYNFNEVLDMINFGMKYEREVCCAGLTPTIKYEKDLIIQDTPENRKKIEMYQAYAKKHNQTKFWIFTFDSQPGNPKRLADLPQRIKTCKWIDTFACIQINGDVLPCCWSKLVLGNILEESFDKIWTGPRYTEFRKMVRAGDVKHCINCLKDG